MTDPGSSAETAGLLRARGWSVRLLLLASVIVLAGVIYNIWPTVCQWPVETAQWRT